MNNLKKEYEGVEAIEFANEKLEKVHLSKSTWEIEYICRETGDIWLMDYPNSSHHGGGSPRLRKILNQKDLF